MLLQEQKELRPPPIGAWGFASCVVPSAGDPNYLGSRAIFHGGWNRFGSFGGINHRINDTVEMNKERNDNFTNCFIILDCEDVLSNFPFPSHTISFLLILLLLSGVGEKETTGRRVPCEIRKGKVTITNSGPPFLPSLSFHLSSLKDKSN
jgi:hypothetical protein